MEGKETINRLKQTQWSPYWRETPHAKQLFALSLSDYPDMLFGGATGSGMTSYLLMAASQYTHDPEWNALIVGRTITQMSLTNAAYDRAIRWWEGYRSIRHDKRRRLFRFPSGATITFGHLATSTSERAYGGDEFTFIGIEASRIPEHQIISLKECVGAPPSVKRRLPLQFRLVATPIEPSAKYLKEQYVFGPLPFLRAKLEDNKAIDTDTYNARLRRMGEPMYTQLRHGDWSI